MFGLEGVTLENFFEIMYANLCNLMTPGHQKWVGKFRNHGRYLKVGGANHGGARAYNGGLGQSPQWVPVVEPLVRGSQGQSSSEAETLLAFGRSMEVANLPTFVKSRNTEKQTFVLFSQCGNCTIPSCFYTPSSHIRSVEWNFVP